MLHRLLVKPHPGVDDTTFRATIADQGGTVIDTIDQINVYVVQFDVQTSKGETISALRSHRHFKFAEDDAVVTANLIPDDPYYTTYQANMPQINAPAAWDLSTGAGVTIAILDSGVDGTHPDLVDNMVAGYNFYNNNTDTADVLGHGTCVAGVAAAALNNTVGMAGVAGDAQIMPIRIVDPNGYATTSTIAKAITYAADQGCRSVNISYAPVYDNATIQTAAAYLQQLGGLLCCAAGNSGAETTTPPTTTMVCVSSINADNSFSSFSTYGNAVQICAPGKDIFCTSKNNTYSLVGGTSFSSPTVAGVVALMFAANPDLTPAQVMSILNSTATDMGSSGRDKYFGYGKVNAGAAVAAAIALEAPTDVADTTPPTVSISSPVAGSAVSGAVTVNVNAADNIGVDHVELYVNGVLYVNDTLAPWTFNWDTTAGSDGTKSLTAKAYDAAGNVATSTAVSVTVSNAADSTAPAVTINSPANGVTIGNKNVTIKATASDAGGVASLTIAIDGVVKASGVNSTTLSYMWNGKKISSGSHVILVTAKDPAGNTGTRSITVTKA